MRLAFLTPLPPSPTGIADYAVEVLALLAGRHDIDVFHDQDTVDADRIPAGCRVLRATGFLDAHRAQPYDVAVYQMGNGPAHAFLYGLLARVPGMLVLHDLVLHHARARMFLDDPAVRAYAAEPGSASRRAAASTPLAAYAAEIAYAYPAQAGRLAEAQLATVGTLLPYAYPLERIPVEASRMVVAHNEYIVSAVRDLVPGVAARRVPMPAEAVPVAPAAVAALRRALGLAPSDFVVGSFGLLTPEKQIGTVARAVSRAAAHDGNVRLLLVGPVPDRPALQALLHETGVAARTVVTGRVDFDALPAHMAAADMVAHLRYPTARETSAALLRVLAQGRPVIVSDLLHLADIPDDAVLRADLTDEEGAVTRAILRLLARPAERARLGSAAAAFVRRAHAPALCRDAYEAALADAARLPDPPRRDWPAHWA
jgi:glycosyltransferase involved in cell wall biosynthesis